MSPPATRKRAAWWEAVRLTALVATALAVPQLPLLAVVALNAQTHAFTWPMIARPGFASAAAALALLVLARVVVQPLEARATAVVVFLLAIVMYPVPPEIRSATANGVLAAGYLVLAAWGAVAISMKARRPWSDVLTLATVAVVGWNAIALTRHILAPEVGRWRQVTDAISASAEVLVPRSGDAHRDIYYIVLDGFGRPDVLDRLFKVDTAEPLRRLREAGVTVPERARSNYSQTYLSLASSLNGSYLDELGRAMGRARDRRPLHNLIQKSGLIAGLRDAGYTFAMIGSNTTLTAEHQLADVCVCGLPAGPTELEYVLLDKTPLRSLGLDRLTLRAHRTAVLSAFESIERMKAQKPSLVFAHVLTPHPPFVFDRDGSERLWQGRYSMQDGSLFPGTREDYERGYGAQATFVLQRVTKLVLMLAARRDPPVIVVVGDHGSGLRLNNSDVFKTDSRERMAIFSAYYSPEASPEVPADMSPVNALRWAIAAATGSRLPLLQNKSYLSSYFEPYRFHEVQEE